MYVSSCNPFEFNIVVGTYSGSSGTKSKQFSRRVLTVGLTKASTENRPASAMYVLDLSSYKWEIIGQFKGKVVSLDFCGNVLYRCQSDPPGLYKTQLNAGKFDIASEERKSLCKRLLSMVYACSTSLSIDSL